MPSTSSRHGLLARRRAQGRRRSRSSAQTTLEWALFDFALALIGAIGAPVYANSSAKDAQYVVTHSEAVGVLCEDEEQRAKIESLGLAHVWTFAELDELRERGRASRAASIPTRSARRPRRVSEDDLFTYIYTSGTTGPPKACMIRHRNYYEMVAVVDQLEDFTSPDDVMLLYLPLAHNFGRLMHLAGPYVGYTIAFLPDPLRTAEALLQVRPTVLPSVPRVYEKVHAAVRAKFDEETGVKRRIVDWALSVGARVSALRQHAQAGAGWARAAAPAGGQARLREGARAARRTGCESRSPAARRSRRRSLSSSTRSASRSSRDTA